MLFTYVQLYLLTFSPILTYSKTIKVVHDVAVSETFKCQNGEIIDAALRCDGDNDCEDGSDELFKDVMNDNYYLGLLAEINEPEEERLCGYNKILLYI